MVQRCFILEQAEVAAPGDRHARRLHATTFFNVEAMVDRKASHLEAAIRKEAA